MLKRTDTPTGVPGRTEGRRAQDRRVDAAVEATFPASDPIAVHRDDAKPAHKSSPRAPVSREERFVTWLKDAHAMETTLASMMDRQAEHAAAHPRLRPRLSEHAKAARRHAELIGNLLHRRGVQHDDLAQWTGGLRPRLQTLMTGSSQRTVMNDTQAGIAAEHFVIACYQGLRAAAEALDDQEAVEVCDEILSEESAMGGFLESQVADLAREELNAGNA